MLLMVVVAAAGAHCRLEVLGQLLLVTVRERERAGAARQGLLIAHTQCGALREIVSEDT